MRIYTTIFVLLLCSVLFGQLSNEVLFRNGSVMLSDNLDEYITESALSRSDITNGRYYKLVQFNAIPTGAEITAMEKKGIQLLDYIPHKAYYVSFPESFIPDQLKSMNVRHVSNMSLDLIISDRIQANEIPDWAYVDRDHIKVSLAADKNMDAETLMSTLIYDGVEVTSYNGHNNIMMAEIPLSDIQRVAALPYIFSLELGPGPSTPDEVPGRALLRANAIDTQTPLGRNYNGEGVAVLCRDDGRIFDHVDFHGRLFQEEEGDFPDRGTHGDGVSGIMAGSGNKDPRNRGMAAGSDLYAVDYVPSFTDFITMQLHLANDVLVTNSSYSDGCNRGYTNTTRTVDEQCFDNPTLMHVFSAGNSNGLDCGYGAGEQWGNITGGHKQGKNVIAVANTNKVGGIENSSSRGPADDGRIKPDLASNGAAHISTERDHGYQSFGGTSGAAPGIAGVMAMLHQAHRELNNEETADAALLKAILMNTADDLGNPGPDFTFGWGTANALRAAIALEERTYEAGTLANDETAQYTVTVPDGARELRVMTYWHDRPGTSSGSRALINDIESRLTTPDGTEHLPLILDFTPNPNTLDLPAVEGEDNLNNQEQLFVANPAAGEYTIDLLGLEVPFADVEYYITWEIRMDEVTLIYPFGGEQLIASRTETVYWEAEPNGQPFTISISDDNGQNWRQLTTAGANAQNTNVGIPAFTSNEVLISISRGNETVISDPMTVTRIPNSFDILEVCGNDMLFSWDPIPGAESYDVYSLGSKFMEVSHTVTDTFSRLPIANPFEITWFAVSANFPNGIKGRRSISGNTDGLGLINCKLDFDLTMRNIAVPELTDFVTCAGTLEETVTVEVVNSGNNSLSNIDISYQINDGPIITELFSGTLETEDTIIYTFADPFTMSEDGDFELKTWISHPNETLNFNDTLTIGGPIYLSSGEEYPITEGFFNTNLPDFWVVDSPLDNVTWVTSFGIGINGQQSSMLTMPFSDINRAVTNDFLSMVPLDLSAPGDDAIILSFEMAYFHNREDDDAFLIDVSMDCGETFTDTIFHRRGAELNTTNFPFSSPEERINWTREEVDLSQFRGNDKVILRLIGDSERGNDLFIDNINIRERAIQTPVANLDVANIPYCTLEPVIVSANTIGGLLDFDWNFGAGALPPTSTQSGPHQISYFLPGEKELSLTLSNSAGTITESVTIQVIDTPSGGFSFDQLGGGQVQFNENFTDANNIFWEFGDGQFSTNSSPTHTYRQPGTYDVTVTISNRCGTRILSTVVIVETTSTNELEGLLEAAIAPNPNQGTFVLTIDSEKQENLNMTIVNTSGQKVDTQSLTLQSGRQHIQIDNDEMVPGLYWVNLSNEKGVKTIRMVIIE